MANPSPPTRNTSGFTSDYPWGPFADCGNGNPAFYHQLFDDFDATLGPTGFWTISKTTTGTVAHAPGDGGLALFSTAATLNDNVSIQSPAASFALTKSKKTFFEARLQLSDIVASAFQIGLIQTTATPGTVTDGLYFSKAAGSTVINLISMVGSVATTLAIPASALALANGSNFDLAWYLARNGDVLAFVGQQLVGWLPMSGIGAMTPPQAGPVARMAAPTLTAANLNVTAALQAGAAAIKTMTLDFICVSKER